MPPKQVVILIDDDPALRDVLRTALMEMDLPSGEVIVYQVGSGAEALLYLGRIRPDLLIVDLELPDTDGVDLCRRLRRDVFLRRVPVLALSGLTAVAEVRERAMAAGATRFLAKPFDLGVFIDDVRELLPRKGDDGGVGLW
jgi:CheY-like chemotaxis protein